MSQLKNLIILGILMIIIQSGVTYAYKSEESTPVHQYIANESIEVWPLVPYEIKEHASNPLDTNIDDSYAIPKGWSYHDGDDIIDGSGEEDVPITEAFQHFWEPDTPQDEKYNDGLDVLWINRKSSYKKAKEYWVNYVIPLYSKGKIDEAYYWLGRVVHLLEDATVTEHIQLDCHIGSYAGNWLIGWTCGGSEGDGGADDSSLEEYTGTNYNNYDGSDYSGDLYYYEDLIDSFDWSAVEPEDKRYIELFRLFWYTAQKTQYYASDDVDGNDAYKEIDGTSKDFSTEGYNLWSGDGATIIDKSEYLTKDDITNSGDNITAVSDAVVPHAMKSVAGLYRLFWDTVNSYDWPTFHHDNRRTGFTLLKGDMEDENDVEELNIVLHKDVTTDAVTRASMSYLDSDDEMDIVVSASKSSTDGWLYRIESSSGGSKLYKRNIVDIGEPVQVPPTLTDTYGNSKKEVFVGLASNGLLKAYDENLNLKWTFTAPTKYSSETGNIRGEIGYTAVEDIDNDGKKEIIFTDSKHNYIWNGSLYILEDNGNSYTVEDTINQSHGGAWGAVSLANIDSDDYTEIIVPTFYGIYVYDFDGSSLTKKYSNDDGRMDGAVAVYDIDNNKGDGKEVNIL